MGVVLASASRARRALLESAGVDVIADPAAVDETAVKRALTAEGALPRAIAEALAELKAHQVSSRHGARLVIGADQILECDGRCYDKPESLTVARAQLRALRGRRHRLISSVVALRTGERLWHHSDEAVLTMRDFSDEFLDNYLGTAGVLALESVGAYQLEGRGAQLISRVEGDYFTILGLPLLALLDFLRAQGELAT